ncbi:MAG: glycoside hydrolase domain-containing protein [Candidatus Firestonebacteria bacterium]
MKYFSLVLCLLLLAANCGAKPVGDVDGKRRSRDLTIKLLIKSGKFVEDQLEVKNTLKEPTAEETARGYILFSKNYLEPVYHNTVPTAKDTLVCASFGSLGEYVPFTFAVYPLKDLKGARVSCKGLFFDKEKIDAENIEVRNVWQMPRRYRPGIFRIIPWLLEKKDTIDIPAGEKLLWGGVNLGPTRQLWVTVKIPEDAKPGLYKGNLEFSPANAKPSEVAVELEVLPIKLVSPKGFNMWFFDNPSIDNDIYVKSLKEHGIYGTTIGIEARVTGNGIDFDYFSGFVDKALKKGLISDLRLIRLRRKATTLLLPLSALTSYFRPRTSNFTKPSKHPTLSPSALSSYLVINIC